MAKKRRTAKQKAATRRMIAANRARAGRSPSSRPKRRRARKSNPAPRTYARRRARRASSAPVRTRRRRRSNPIGGGIVRELQQALVPSAIGGAGALAVDVAMAALPLPEALKTGVARPVARIAAAVGIGAIAGMVTKNRRMGNQVMAGALTVVLYDTIKGALAKVVGGKIPGIGVYDLPGIGVYEVQPAEPMLLPDGTIGYPGYALQTGGDMVDME